CGITVGMKPVFMATVLLWVCAPVRADEASDRREIQKTIDALANPDADPADIWAPGVDRFAERSRINGGPMSEAFGVIHTGVISFQDAFNATVLATRVQFSSTNLTYHSIRLKIKVKKTVAGWRIAEISAASSGIDLKVLAY